MRVWFYGCGVLSLAGDIIPSILSNNFIIINFFLQVSYSSTIG